MSYVSNDYIVKWNFECIKNNVIISFLVPCLVSQLDPRELELGSCRRPSVFLVEGSVRALKPFKNTCREFRCCITVDSYISYSDESRTKGPPRDTITLLYIYGPERWCVKNYPSVLGVVVWSCWLETLSFDRIFTSGSIRHKNVIVSHVLFNPSKRTVYPSSTSGFRRLISLQVTRSRDQVSPLITRHPGSGVRSLGLDTVHWGG